MAGPRQRKAETGLTHLRITLSDSFYIGPGRADLMSSVAETGSISEAAKRMGMSYKRAWSLVQALNEGFGVPLIETMRGGKEQGAALSAAGAEVLERYRAMQAAARQAIGRDFEALERLQLDMSKRK